MEIAGYKSSAENQLAKLRYNMQYSILSGSYKDYKTDAKVYARYAVEHKELLDKVHTPKLSVPLFSKYGMRMLKIMFLNFFRTKTPEEKELKKISKEIETKRKLDKLI